MGEQAPGRRTTDPLEFDPGEQVLRAIDGVVRLRLDGCPWRLAQDPFVRAVLEGFRWYAKGELSTRAGGEPPEALMRGISVFESATLTITAHDQREMMKPKDPPPGGHAGSKIQWTPLSRRPRPNRR